MGRAGYGWINCDSQKEDAYVHFEDIVMDGFKTLDNGGKVNFALVLQKGGMLKAVKVSPAKSAAPAKKKSPKNGPRKSPKSAPMKKKKAAPPPKKKAAAPKKKSPKAAPMKKSAPKKKARTPPKKKMAAPKKKVAGNRSPGSQTGTVKGCRKSSALIVCDNGDGNAKVDYSDVVGGGRLKNGQTVRFSMVKLKGGDIKAVNVTIEAGKKMMAGKKKKAATPPKRGRGRGRGRGARGRGRGRGKARASPKAAASKPARGRGARGRGRPRGRGRGRGAARAMPQRKPRGRRSNRK